MRGEKLQHGLFCEHEGRLCGIHAVVNQWLTSSRGLLSRKIKRDGISHRPTLHNQDSNSDIEKTLTDYEDALKRLLQCTVRLKRKCKNADYSSE